jgi:hypothetical protein
MKESTFEGVGGLTIFTRSWQPEGKTRGVAQRTSTQQNIFIQLITL